MWGEAIERDWGKLEAWSKNNTLKLIWKLQDERCNFIGKKPAKQQYCLRPTSDD